MSVAIKDFRRVDDYPNWQGLSAWRWEFLRRDPEYQQFFAQHKDDVRGPYCGMFGIRSLHDPAFDRAFEVFNDGASLIELPTFEWVKKWEQVSGYTDERGLKMILKTLTELQSRGSALVAIDRSLPLEMQLEQIREAVALRNERGAQIPPMKNDRRNEWPSYLRVLDGIAAQATHDDIAAAVYPDTENIYPDFAGRKRVKAAAKRAAILCRAFGRKDFSPAEK